MTSESSESSPEITPTAKRKVYNTKNPDSPRLADFPDKASYSRAYQEYFRRKNPDYLKNWIARPENVERYTPPPVVQPPCHKCGSEKEKCEDGVWRCLPCAAKKEENRQMWLDRIAAAPARREQKRLAKELAAQQKAEKELKKQKEKEEKAIRAEIRVLKESRPNELVDGFFLLEDERARFYSKIREDGDCLVWTGSKEFDLGRLEFPPHRMLWFLDNGPIPPGKALNKLCTTKNCINPLHRRLDDQITEKKAKPVYVPSFRPIPNFTEEQLERFHAKVNKNGDCWVYTGQSDPEGYGRFTLFGIQYPAHRVAYRIANGTIDNTLQVHHECDSAYCVNPAHLSQGDHSKNNRDSFERRRVGSDEFAAKLIIPDEDEKREIMRLLKLDVRRTAISRKFGVSDSMIQKVADDMLG